MTACRVVFDSGRCSSIGLCEAAMPDVFQLGSDGSMRLLVEDFALERRRELEDAVSNCPTQSLSVEIVD